jgi:hypothetical protein
MEESAHVRALTRQAAVMTISSETLAALIFLFFGVVAMVFGAGYGFGTPRALGAGAMPMLVGGALCILGVVQLLRAFRHRAGLPSAFSRSELRPLLLILAAVFAFATLVIPTGLVPALAALIAIAWFAEKGGRGVELAAAMVVVILVMIAIFSFGLGLPIRLFAWRF